MAKKRKRQAEETPNLGRCCICEEYRDVLNIVCLGRKAPLPDTGWGCVVCGLPADGAIAVVCNYCMREREIPKDIPLVCCGYPGNDVRAPITDCTEPFQHDEERHRNDAAVHL